MERKNVNIVISFPIFDMKDMLGSVWPKSFPPPEKREIAALHFRVVEKIATDPASKQRRRNTLKPGITWTHYPF